MNHTCILPTITYATLGAKGQIVIPKEARDKLHVGPGDKVVLIIEDGRLMIISPDGVQQMIQILQESVVSEESVSTSPKKTKKKGSSKKSIKKSSKK